MVNYDCYIIKKKVIDCASIYKWCCTITATELNKLWNLVVKKVP